jgi:hypothetical protein
VGHGLMGHGAAAAACMPASGLEPGQARWPVRSAASARSRRPRSVKQGGTRRRIRWCADEVRY